jgi:hypothetical protein
MTDPKIFARIAYGFDWKFSRLDAREYALGEQPPQLKT